VQNAKLPHHGPPVKIFTLEELSTAAANFSADALIGRGGFGAVYIGKLSDGTPVAVKRLSGLSMQGEAEFRTEVGMIAHQLYSPHLVRLLGYSSQGDERILCYELMTRGSLLDYLKGQSEHLSCFCSSSSSFTPYLEGPYPKVFNLVMAEYGDFLILMRVIYYQSFMGVAIMGAQSKRGALSA
jgi:hypothetical protein